ncbi:hypothetical protein DUNSADRAFT_13624 [Dunaliella salina]|uniref:Encoded protein n=1 Tax=Dunaliella salina TaxID=3046 RepID=A0ABQ7G912_DUNSA|nr:hypothetical protein DUNSADRAFT_13624 [Dunaliella salina]|eukprot:KAF5831093.1 hypothetical protein DUNSADRAFT_13624 [Dunaliella salina]
MPEVPPVTRATCWEDEVNEVDMKKCTGHSEGIVDENQSDDERCVKYKVDEKTTYLTKGRARIQVDVLPIGPEGARVAAVNYFHGIP